MKSPSKNISESLRGQRVPGRGPEQISVTELSRGGVSMTVPGDGKVEMPPGEVDERSAAHYTGPMKRFGG